MYRLLVICAFACLISGCASSSLPAVANFAEVGPQATTEFTTAKRSGLGVASTTSDAAASADEVPVNSSAKAPKGALADRDYSEAQLDPSVALKLLNEYRASKGLKPLRLDPRLVQAAKMLSRDLAKTDRISHYGSDGSSPWDRVKRAGYDAAIAAENVGTGQASLAEVLKGWEESPGHNRNLLLPGAKDMGIALVADPKTEFKTFWTLVVASSK